MISRFIQDELIRSIHPGFVTGLFGARRTGKTFLMEQIRTRIDDKKILVVQGDNLDVAELLSSRRLSVLKQFVAGSIIYLLMRRRKFLISELI